MMFAVRLRREMSACRAEIKHAGLHGATSRSIIADCQQGTQVIMNQLKMAALHERWEPGGQKQVRN